MSRKEDGGMNISTQGGGALPSRKVHLVDDDPMVRNAMARLLRLHDFEVVTHDSAGTFLASYDRDEPACALVDVAMPVMDGLSLQAELLQREDAPPLVFLSGLTDVPSCAKAMRNGAVDFLRKPVDEETLVDALETALTRGAQQRARRRFAQDVAARFASLTGREAEVLRHVMDGRLNKQIAHDLGIAEKTVKVHRARAMEKMGVRSVAEVVRLAERSARA
jgi:FixJ family two-component response regulator